LLPENIQRNAPAETKQLAVPGAHIVERLAEPPRRFLRRHVARFEHLQLSLEVRHDSDKQSVRQGAVDEVGI
jgi:hypothetical protein